MARLVVGFNDLNTTHPELSKQALGWDPKTVTAGSKRKSKWMCSLSHEWEAEVKDRSKKNSGCPVCFGRKVLPGFNDLKTKYPEIAKQAIGWNPETISAGSHKKYKWKCEFGHEWYASPNHRTSNHQGCNVCGKSGGFKPNKESYLYLIFNKNIDMFKIGITNDPKRRLGEHGGRGWELVEIIGPKNGNEIRSIEFSILKALKGFGVSLPSKNVKKFDGYTESWSKSEYYVEGIDDLLKIAV